MTMQPICGSAFQAIQGLVHLADDLCIEGVQRLGAVESDQADPALDVQQNGFVAHESAPAKSQRLREMTMR